MTSFVPERIADLVYWVYERDLIRAVKDSTYAPWTKDPVLREWRFCCPCRMDDSVSRWLHQHFYAKPLSAAEALARVAMGRLINWPETLSGLIGQPFDRARLESHLRARKARKEKVFTNAYIISPGTDRTLDKIGSVVKRIAVIHDSPGLLKPHSMEATWRGIATVPDVGPFIAGQFTADLRYAYPGRWSDAVTWAPVGKGSNRGMAWLLGWDGKRQIPAADQRVFLPRLQALQVVLRRHEKFMAVWNDRGMEAMDLQNVLCELDKMLRVRTGTGKPKVRYAPQRHPAPALHK